jgi:AbrB family looped-hinge helix DNA binding protein
MNQADPLVPVEPPDLDALPTKAARIRALAVAGFARGDIARRLGVRYQHVRNVLERKIARPSPGVSEDQAPFVVDRTVQLKVGADGRVVIPAAIRVRMGLGEDAILLARLEGDELRLYTPATGLRRAQALVRRYVPEGVSLVDELIAERRREAERE